MTNYLHAAYINALLTDTAYVRLQEGADSDPVGVPLLSGDALTLRIATRLTLPQAEFITANFEVLSQELSPTGGFDAVVWRGRADTEFAGQVYVSMRGTQESQDFSDDASLVSRGVPYNQIRDMVNWWLKSTASPSDIEVKQVKIVEAPGLVGVYTFELDTPTTGTGALPGLSTIAAVNGHSLGGYLSTAFTRLFGTGWDVQGVNTFNSAGFNSLTSLNTDVEFAKLANLIGPTLGLDSWTTVGQLQTNYFAENGLSVTTNSWADFHLLAPGFHQYGERIGLYQEEGANPTANHSMYKQTDWLALGFVLQKLDSSLNVERLNPLVQAGSHNMGASYEGVLDASPMATPNCSTYGRSNCSRQDGRIMTMRV